MELRYMEEVHLERSIRTIVICGRTAAAERTTGGNLAGHD
jgi:hypothetical protein